MPPMVKHLRRRDRLRARSERVRILGIKKRWFLLLTIVLTLSAIAGLRALSLLRAASILYDVTAGRPPLPIRAYSKLFHDGVDVTHTSIVGPQGNVDVFLYTPHTRPDAPIIVFVHGMAPQGNQDPSVINFAHRMASLGIRIATPTITSSSALLMRTDSIDQIAATVHWAANLSGKKVSLFGISFSGGLVIAAACHPDIAKDLRLVFAIAGYNHLVRLGHYYIHDGEFDPAQKREPADPMAVGADLIAFQYPEEMIPTSDMSAILPAVNEAIHFSPQTTARDHLTPPQRTYFNNLSNATTLPIRQRYLDLLHCHDTYMGQISPHTQLAQLTVPLYMIHSASDPTIPTAEALWNLHDAPATLETHLLVTPSLRHAALDIHAPLVEKLRVGDYLAHILDLASHNNRYLPAPFD